MAQLCRDPLTDHHHPQDHQENHGDLGSGQGGNRGVKLQANAASANKSQQGTGTVSRGREAADKGRLTQAGAAGGTKRCFEATGELAPGTIPHCLLCLSVLGPILCPRGDYHRRCAVHPLGADWYLWRAQHGRCRAAPEVGRIEEPLFHCGDKAIALAGHGLDAVLRLSAIAKRPAYYGNTPFQGGVAHAPLRPQVLEQLVAQHHTLAMLQEVGERVKHLGLKSHPYPGAAQFIQPYVESIVAKDVQGLLCTPQPSKSLFPRPLPQGTPEALAYPILRRMSSTSQSCPKPCSAALRLQAAPIMPRGLLWLCMQALSPGGKSMQL